MRPTQVRCRDAYGNAIDAEPRTRFWLELRLVRPNYAGDTGGGNTEGRGLVSCVASWAGDGMHELRYVSTLAGTFDVVLWCELP